MINYIIQVILFQVLFLAIYDFLLSKETFFSKNRWYLLSAPILSFILPFVKIPTFQKAVPEKLIIYLPEIILSPEKTISATNLYQSINYLDILFLVGVIIFSMLFFMKLIKIISLIKTSKIIQKDGYKLILIPNQTKAFSFFNYIFLGKEIPISQQEQIIEHELVHSKQRHSLDLLVFEFLKIVMWFNPVIFIYQKRITLIHEYISDEVTAKSNSKENYINNLLSNFFQVENISFINQFYKQSFIKKRIIMMTKRQSKKMNQLKYLVLIPVLLSMLFYTSCSEVNAENKVTAERELQVQSIERKENSKMQESKKGSEERVEVSFMTIHKTPTFPGCESGDKKCFSKKVQKHFVKNFNGKLLKQLGLKPGKKKIYVTFKVNDKGNVIDIQARAPHKELESEVLKVMSTLPRMLPGEQEDGQKVTVKYSIPITVVIK